MTDAFQKEGRDQARDAETLRQIEAAAQSGDLARAVALAERALASGFEHAALFNIRAFAHEHHGRDREALADLERARALSPRNVPILNALGLFLARHGQLEEAIAIFDEALEVQPDFFFAHFNKGWTYEMALKLDESRRSHEKAVAIKPDFAEPMAHLASLAVRRSDWTTARDYAERCLALAPDRFLARLAKARADFGEKKFDLAEQKFLAILRDTSLAPFERYQAHGFYGDLLHTQKRFPEAFEAYAKSNAELHRASAAQFEGKPRTIHTIRWLTDHFEETPSTRWRDACQPVEDPDRPVAGHVFLLGYPRSGTTLLEQVLASHPDMITLEEREAFFDSALEFMAHPSGMDRLADLDAAGVAKWRKAYWERVRSFGLDVRGKVFVDKLPFNTLKLPLVAKLFPEAKVLLALRDPRDVVLSCFRRRFRMNPYVYDMLVLDDAARFYDATMRLCELYRAKLPLALYQHRYEDLVEDFDAKSRAICDFIGVPWNDAMRNFTQAAKVRPIASPSAGQVARGLYREGMQQWRAYEKELSPILPILQPWIERYGYAD